MTKEEVLEDGFRTLKDIFSGRAVFVMLNCASAEMTLDYEKYSVAVNVLDDGWQPRAFNNLIHEVVKDLELKLQQYKIEDSALQERALRKVTIRNGNRTDATVNVGSNSSCAGK